MNKLLKSKATILFLLPPLFFPTQVKTRFVEIHNEKEFNKHVMKNKQPTLVQFSADWCGVCQTVKKPFEDVARDSEFKGITFARVNIDQNINLSKKHEIMGVPTFLYISDGQKVKNEVGVKNIDNFKDSLRSNVRNTFHLTQVDTGLEVMDEMMGEGAAQEMSEGMDEMMGQGTAQEMAEDMEDMSNQAMAKPEGDQEEAGMMDKIQDAMEDVQETTEKATGFLANIKNMIMGIANAITGLIKAVMDIITGLFGR